MGIPPGTSFIGTLRPPNTVGTMPARCDCHDCTQARWKMYQADSLNTFDEHQSIKPHTPTIERTDYCICNGNGHSTDGKCLDCGKLKYFATGLGKSFLTPEGR